MTLFPGFTGRSELAQRLLYRARKARNRGGCDADQNPAGLLRPATGVGPQRLCPGGMLPAIAWAMDANLALIHHLYSKGQLHGKHRKKQSDN